MLGGALNKSFAASQKYRLTRLSHEPFLNAYSCVLVTKALVRYAASTHCRMDMHASWFVRQPLTCAFSGPPGARTRHLGIKSAGQDLAKCYRAVRNVAISQVGVAIQPERRDSSRLTATGCDGLVGTVQLDVICGRPVSGARSTVEGRWALQPAGSHR
jgi:hypothetical protein